MVKRLVRRSLLAVAILDGACAGSWAGSPEKAAAQATAAATSPDLVTDTIGSVFRDRWRVGAHTSVAAQAGRACAAA